MANLMEPVDIEILWQDNLALVVNKPAGLLTQAPAEIASLESRLRALPNLGTYLAFAHRIDRPVSGAVLVARNVRAARRFGEQFQSRKIGKTYLAIVAGQVKPWTGEWIDWMRKIPGQAQAEIVAPDAPGGRQAILNYQVIQSLCLPNGQPASLLEIELQTGRMHQIRLQCAVRGFPLLGDALYQSPPQQSPPQHPFGTEATSDRERLIALHARRLTFHHPKTGVRTTVTAPLPQYWFSNVEELSLSGESEAS
ncbi:RluA family pseudouridine synthase [Planctomycetaceae bacterium SH139]